MVSIAMILTTFTMAITNTIAIIPITLITATKITTTTMAMTAR